MGGRSARRPGHQRDPTCAHHSRGHTYGRPSARRRELHGRVSQSKGVTLTSNQTLSFQLVHLPPAPAPPAGTTIISFNGLTANSASISRYTESGFTVLPASAAWVAVTTYGNPAPSIQFFGQVG